MITNLINMLLNDLEEEFDKYILNNIIKKHGAFQVHDIMNNQHDLDQPIDQLCGSLEIYARLNISAEQVIREIVWRIGQDQILFGNFFVNMGANKYKLRDNIYSMEYPTLGKELEQYYPGIYTAEQLGYRVGETNYDNVFRAQNNRLLRWALEQKHELSYNARIELCAYAAENGLLDILVWGLANGCPWKNLDLCGYAAKGGQLHILEWLRDNNFKLTNSIYRYAQMNGHDHVIEWFRSA